MKENLLAIADITQPAILAEEKDFLIVYKPPRFHSAPQENSDGGTITEWVIDKYPETANLDARKEGEGGLLHRLDFQTHGLLLFARTQHGMKSLLSQQKKGEIIKGYSALTAAAGNDAEKKLAPGFPNFAPGFPVTSAFRPYGEGRKAVRPELVKEFSGAQKLYTTHLLKMIPIKKTENSFDIVLYQLLILNGFRHQIRCHLAWLGRPILNDDLYGGPSYGNGFLGLRAGSLEFYDPSTGRKSNYFLTLLSLNDICSAK